MQKNTVFNNFQEIKAHIISLANSNKIGSKAKAADELVNILIEQPNYITDVMADREIRHIMSGSPAEKAKCGFFAGGTIFLVVLGARPYDDNPRAYTPYISPSRTKVIIESLLSKLKNCEEQSYRKDAFRGILHLATAEGCDDFLLIHRLLGTLLKDKDYAEYMQDDWMRQYKENVFNKLQERAPNLTNKLQDVEKELKEVDLSCNSL